MRAAVFLSLMLCLPMAAQTSVDRQVTASKQRAATLAKAGKWDGALKEIHDTRTLVRTARRKDSRGVVAAPVPPAYKAAVEALEARIQAKARTGPRDPRRLETLKQEYLAGKQRLAARYGVGRVGAVANWQASEARVMARYDLVEADLATVESGLQRGKGVDRRARELREEAAVKRLGAYRVLGQRPAADKTARALLNLPPLEVPTFQALGEFFQQAGQWKLAAQAWEQGVRRLERQPNARLRRQYVPLFCRQLAFCYSRLGRGADAQRALARGAAVGG